MMRRLSDYTLCKTAFCYLVDHTETEIYLKKPEIFTCQILEISFEILSQMMYL